MITASTLRFLDDLALNNDKEWFDANRVRYENDVKAPFRSLVSSLIDTICMADMQYHCTPQQAVFRINRDTRFSKDKRPYKTNLAAAIGPGGRKGSPSFYVHLEPATLMIGGGAYAVTPEQLVQVRRYVTRHPDALPRAVADEAFASFYGDVLGETNKVLPLAFRDAAGTPYLANKQWYFMKEMPSADLLRAPDQVMMLFDAFLAARPVNAVLRAALEESEVRP
ncbi:MAG: DUF2461 domain-containing protein [Candidatus Kapaibacterium sp.]